MAHIVAQWGARADFRQRSTELDLATAENICPCPLLVAWRDRLLDSTTESIIDSTAPITPANPNPVLVAPDAVALQVVLSRTEPALCFVTRRKCTCIAVTIRATSVADNPAEWHFDAKLDPPVRVPNEAIDVTISSNGGDGGEIVKFIVEWIWPAVDTWIASADMEPLSRHQAQDSTADAALDTSPDATPRSTSLDAS